ncbi:MAG: hypoxanthine phosphoribosyltransferase [Clostridiales Family XIII bacterium]|jgi:hypoxanthine phosphoribosyltransferase|nr:hypoxanthine phosphoribosyltransferase [Clostridiales Family XIII bacterium]
MTAYKPGEVILTRGQIEARAAEIGRQITADYAGREVFLIGILTGCVMWMAEVMKSIDLDTSVDFMSVSSYGSATRSSGVVKIIKDLNQDIDGKHALIVEDIVDSGVTLDYLCKYLEGRGPASLKICAMLDKPSGRRTPIDADYVGFEAPNVFLVGYGLDANQKYRNLPFIAAVEKV